MASNSSIFMGTSRYSSDFQSVIQRSVAIASLGLQQMQNVRSSLDKQSQALSGLDGGFATLQNALSSLESATGINSFTATSSDDSVANAAVSEGAVAGTYTLNVTKIGSFSSALSLDTLPSVADPASKNFTAGTEFTIKVGPQNSEKSTQFHFTGKSLNELVRAINASGADVQATVVNVGTNSAPKYRLSVQGTKLGNNNIQINDGSKDLLAMQSWGEMASYSVNGAQAAGSDSRQLSLSPGLKVNVLAEGSTAITVAQGTSGIVNALGSFVIAFNSVSDQLDQQHGQAGGALAGQSIVFSLGQTLRGLYNYGATSGSLRSLTNIGVTIDDKGKLSFDSSKLTAAADQDFGAVLNLLGGSASGGFLKAATDILDGVEGATDGFLKTSINSLSSQISAQDQRIAAEQERIDQFGRDLTERINAADALIASLEQQALYVTNLFDAMKSAEKSYQ